MIKPVAYLTNRPDCKTLHTAIVAETFYKQSSIDEMTPLYAIPEGHSITEDRAAWEVKKLLALAWEAIQEAGYEDHSFELRDKIDQYLNEAGGVK